MIKSVPTGNGKILRHEISNDYCKIEIPDKGEIGKPFTVKLDKKVPTIELEIGDGIEIYKPNRLTDPDGVERPIASCFLKETKENTDEITVNLEKYALIRGERFNALTPTKLLVSVYAHGTESNEEECIVKEVQAVD